MIRINRKILHLLILMIGSTLFVSIQAYTQSRKVEQEILRHGEAVREAFSKGDIEKITSFHHPEVMKALGYNNLLNGRDTVINDLTKTLENFNLSFVENEIESILTRGDMAIEQTRFSIKGTPKDGSEPFIFKGRTMVTYVRYDESPTGWATIREIIQPATE